MCSSFLSGAAVKGSATFSLLSLLCLTRKVEKRSGELMQNKRSLLPLSCLSLSTSLPLSLSLSRVGVPAHTGKLSETHTMKCLHHTEESPFRLRLAQLFCCKMLNYVPEKNRERRAKPLDNTPPLHT